MTSIHTSPANADPTQEPSAPDSPSSHSSFSDAYDEQPKDAQEQKEDVQQQGSDGSDDYAMTFDSDAENQADSSKLSQETIVPPPQSLSTAAATVFSLVSSPKTNEPTEPQTQSNPSSSHRSSIEDPDAHVSEEAEPPIETEPPKSPVSTHEEVSNGEIDIQQLLDSITANAEKNAPQLKQASPSPSPNALSKIGTGLPTHASLPPRPNVPPMRHDDIQKYHAGVPGAPPAATAFRAAISNGQSGSLNAAPGAPGRSADTRGGLPPPPSISSGNISPASYSHAPGVQTSIESRDEADALDAKWAPEVQKIYDQFIDNERMYVMEGLWDQFPDGSRLFIGNLSSESVTKRDLFHVFYHYGKIAQISIKQAYGFVQFHESSSCYNALKREEGCEVRGRKIHLEISKPQKNTKQKPAPEVSRRSRSPPSQRGQPARGADRYDGRNSTRTSVDEYGRPIRMRDDYRHLRSPTPPRNNFRGRDDYAQRNNRDSYDTRDRRRSRSRSPPYGARNDNNNRYRDRSPSPRSREAEEDANLPFPRRDPRDVPDIQIIPLERLDRQFLSWIQNEMRGRVKVDVCRFDPRVPIQAIVRRQILEGVHAVAKLDMRAQNSCKISLQVFDRKGGSGEVRFDEYQDLDPKIAAELVVRAKSGQQAPPPPQTVPFIPPQQYGNHQQFQPPPQAFQQPPQQQAPASQPSLANLVGSLDNATLQKLLGTLGAIPQTPQMPIQQQQAQQHNVPAVNANSGLALAGLIGGIQQQQQHQGYQPHVSQQPPVQYGGGAHGYGGNGVGGVQQQPVVGQPQQSAQQSAQQVQNIMAQLARFRQ